VKETEQGKGPSAGQTTTALHTAALPQSSPSCAVFDDDDEVFVEEEEEEGEMPDAVPPPPQSEEEFDEEGGFGGWSDSDTGSEDGSNIEGGGGQGGAAESESDTGTVAHAGSAPAPVKRGRGRPRKYPLVQPSAASTWQRHAASAARERDDDSDDDDDAGRPYKKSGKHCLTMAVHTELLAYLRAQADQQAAAAGAGSDASPVVIDVKCPREYHASAPVGQWLLQLIHQVASGETQGATAYPTTAVYIQAHVQDKPLHIAEEETLNYTLRSMMAKLYMYKAAKGQGPAKLKESRRGKLASSARSAAHPPQALPPKATKDRQRQTTHGHVQPPHTAVAPRAGSSAGADGAATATGSLLAQMVAPMTHTVSPVNPKGKDKEWAQMIAAPLTRLEIMGAAIRCPQAMQYFPLGTPECDQVAQLLAKLERCRTVLASYNALSVTLDTVPCVMQAASELQAFLHALLHVAALATRAAGERGLPALWTPAVLLCVCNAVTVRYLALAASTGIAAANKGIPLQAALTQVLHGEFEAVLVILLRPPQPAAAPASTGTAMGSTSSGMNATQQPALVQAPVHIAAQSSDDSAAAGCASDTLAGHASSDEAEDNYTL
jgi:hypothetical protein